MQRAEIERQRHELIERLRRASAISPRVSPLQRKALGLLTRTWMRTPALRHLALLKTAMWLSDIADKYPMM